MKYYFQKRRMILCKVQNHSFPYMGVKSLNLCFGEKQNFFSCFQLENMKTEFAASCQVTLHPLENIAGKTWGFLGYPDDLEYM